MDTLISVLGLALLTTKIVDTIRNIADRRATQPKGVWNIGAFAVGVAVAYTFVAAGFDIEGAGPSTLGTGLLIGAAASGWHEVLDRISP